MSFQSIHGETEKRQPQLQAVVDLAEALKAVLRGHGGLVDDKVSLLRCNWIAVTSRAEEWLNLLLVRERNRILKKNLMMLRILFVRAKNKPKSLKIAH